MDNLNKKTKGYFILSIMELFILMSLFFLSPALVTPKNYVLLCLTFFLGILAFSTQLVVGLLASLFLVFIYGSLILYKAIFGGNLEFSLAKDYFWLLVFPVVAYTFGRLGVLANEFSDIITDLRQEVKNLVRVDSLTGFNNKQKFYEDLYDEMRRAKRHDFDLAVAMVKVMYFSELVAMYGRDKADDIIRLMVKNIQQALRYEDKKYRLEADTVAFILPNTNKEGAEVVKERLRKSLDHITLFDGEKQERLNFNFKMGILSYDKKSDDVLAFKQRLEQELQYDV
ncbi:MAG: diguanylate cyclase [Firmicutes bacterium]|jgi:diguanylate cyclase (GGDEF)-like protein|nr:diguanylate cyclase [Bacillota bacterium]